MSNLKRALTGQRKPGIYRFRSRATVDFLDKEASRAGWHLYVLNGSKVYNKPTFLETIARAMKFPDYFGKNWDALNDCLTDMEWDRAKGYVLLFDSPDRFVKTSPGDFKMAAEIFQSAIEFWRQFNIPFYLLLRGGAPSDIPEL